MTSARRDLVAGGVTIAAIVIFVGTGSSSLASAMRALNGIDAGGDRMLLIALLLNIALILFGWRRYRELTAAVAERADAEQRAQALASRDPLTGFLNRRALIGETSAMLVQAERRHKAVALLSIDLDQFKNVNDVHGHLAGDAVLRAVAEAIARALPPSALTARLDGDEFAAALLFDPANPGMVDAITDYVVGQLAKPFYVEGVHAHISASIGVARSEADCASVDALLRRADIAMHSAKALGRNRHAWFDGSMERELVARNAIEAGLRDGIPAGEFVPYYEQQIDLTSGKLHGFEVLARWEHPTRGLIAPDAFIPIAEECGLLGALSMAVMRRAFEEARDWDPSLTLSVNISPSQLKDPWLAQKIVKLLVETGYPANRLEVEITESSLFENLAVAQSIVGSLKNQGIRIALDDFGTGYSSLAHLRALPFDRIKIDKSFVISINENSESAAIVNTIARLGESLNLPITAEGIENGQIQERLRGLGCHKGQGWHFGKPMAIGDARTLLAAQGLLPSARQAAETSVPVTDAAVALLKSARRTG